MRLAIGTSLTGAGFAPSEPFFYQARVTADGGTVADPSHSYIVFSRVTATDRPTLLCSCDAGKAAVLYSLIVFDDIDTFITRVTSAVIEDTDFLIETTHDLLRAEVYEKASLVNVCVAGDAGNLYSLKA